MLVRSSSTPIMKLWIQTHHPSSEIHISSPRTSWSPKQRKTALCRALSETDLKELSSPKLKSTPKACGTRTLLEDIESDESETSSIDDEVVATGPCFENDGCGGGGGSGRGWSEKGGGNDNESEMEEYYKSAMKENPGSGLILGNYARFLKEVKGDVERAKEYCERAILAKSDDGYVLAMYGELIWESERDSLRAKSYFDQAVKSAPENCYVLGSCARFMWDAEDDDDNEEEEEEEGSNSVEQGGCLICGVEKAKLMKSFAVLPPLAASS